MFIYFQGYPNKQLNLTIITAVIYFFWGILTHYAENDLHPKIMVEYLLIAILAVIIIRGAIIR